MQDMYVRTSGRRQVEGVGRDGHARRRLEDFMLLSRYHAGGLGVLRRSLGEINGFGVGHGWLSDQPTKTYEGGGVADVGWRCARRSPGLAG